MKSAFFSIQITISFIILSGISPSLAAQSKSILKLADEYSRVLKEIETQKNRRSIEAVLQKGAAVGEKLDELESLSDMEYAELVRKMRGFDVNRDEIVFIEPDAQFFKKLAIRRGDQADIAFFNLMLEIKPENVWPAYIEQQTDVTGCTIYGNGLLTKLYGKTRQFKKNYPLAYADRVEQETSNILKAFTENVCACGNRASVTKEFRLFIKKYPTNKNTVAIKKRLAEIQKSKDFRFNCQSG